MRLVSSISVWVVIGCIFGCSDRNETETKRSEAIIVNQSDQKLNMRMFISSEFYESVEILPGSSYSCTYNQFMFRGLAFCPTDVNIGSGIGSIDSVLIKFENMSGYVCQLMTDDNSRCFGSSRNPLEGIGFEEDRDTYTFIITQEDYENAHVLPE